MSSSKNLEFEKTSFLSKSNSVFIERMYLKFVNKDADLPESWKDYFTGIGDELNIIAKENNTKYFNDDERENTISTSSHSPKHWWW